MAAAARAATAVAVAMRAAGAMGPARRALQRPAPRRQPPPLPLWQHRLPPPLRLEPRPPAAELGLCKGTLWAQDGNSLASWYHIAQGVPATQKRGVQRGLVSLLQFCSLSKSLSCSRDRTPVSATKWTAKGKY